MRSGPSPGCWSSPRPRGPPRGRAAPAGDRARVEVPRRRGGLPRPRGAPLRFCGPPPGEGFRALGPAPPTGPPCEGPRDPPVLVVRLRGGPAPLSGREGDETHERHEVALLEDPGGRADLPAAAPRPVRPAPDALAGRPPQTLRGGPRDAGRGQPVPRGVRRDDPSRRR